ncbi:MAG: hypothetical protein JWQ23_3768 [Herminiimonas sp.]|nr:hypothetical protein [Herminiimonas sp.]
MFMLRGLLTASLIYDKSNATSYFKIALGFVVFPAFYCDLQDGGNTVLFIIGRYLVIVGLLSGLANWYDDCVSVQ